ncbi:MAG: LacI family DNA-binding transcriptional regulator [Planctomycetota bacterium]
MATLKQVAVAAGVSTFTVSRVLSGRGRESRISDQRISQVEKVAAKLGYRPNAAARATREKRTRLIGVLTFTHVDAPEFTPQNQLIVQGINRELEKFGYLTSLIRINDLWECGEVKHRAFAEQLVDGIAAINILPTSLEEQLDGHFKNCVWVDANVFKDGRCVRRDEYMAGRLLVEHAARVGYEHIIYLDDFDDDGDLEPLIGYRHYSWTERGDGVREAAEEHGLGLEVIPCGYHWEPGFARVGERFDEKCLVLGYGIAHSRMAIRMAMECGLMVGRDFGLACCEWVPELGVEWPGLCHADFDRLAMGEEAARLLVEQIDASLKTPKSHSSAKQPKVIERDPIKQAPTLVVGDSAPGPGRYGATEC